MIEITFASVVSSIFTSSLLVVLIYFFRKKESIASIFGVYTMIALYAVTFFRMFFPVEIKNVTVGIGDYNIYPKIVEFLTPDPQKYFVFEFSFLNLLIFVWGAGAVFFTIRFFIKYFKAIYDLKSASMPADEQQCKILDKAAHECGIKRKITLIATDRVDSPATYGFFKPVVVVSVYDYDNTSFYYIARHECCHTKNKDIWVKLLTELYCALFWWNPIVYLLKKDLISCLEIRCDKRAMKGFNDEQTVEYANVLIEETKRVSALAADRKKRAKNPLMAGFDFADTYDSKNFSRRINLIVYPKGKGKKSSIPVIIFTVLFVVAFVSSYFVVVQPGWDPKPEDYLMPGESLDTITPYETDDMYVYEKKDGTYILVFEPYDEKKGVVITGDNYFVIPKEDIEDGYYHTYKFVKEK